MPNRQSKKFANGFLSWAETHYEVTEYISRHHTRHTQFAFTVHNVVGTYGLYELAEQWTDEWENNHVGVKWDDDNRDYWTEIEAWLKTKNKN